jgi:hypothetical protein
MSLERKQCSRSSFAQAINHVPDGRTAVRAPQRSLLQRSLLHLSTAYKRGSDAPPTATVQNSPIEVL